MTNKKLILTACIAFIAGLFLMWLMTGSAKQPAPQQTTAEETVWTCSMHPQIKREEPGKCPICSMDLIPLEEAQDDGGQERMLQMSKTAKKLAQIQTATVQRKIVEKQLHLFGKVAYDETRLKYITAWFPGRIEQLFVNYTGTPVKKGDHLAEIYSPDIVSDQQTLLQAQQVLNELPETASAQRKERLQETLEQARERLRLLGLTDRQIQEIEQRDTAAERVTFYSPMDGIVIHKNAFEGEYVQKGTRIYTLADLSQVWVLIDAYETDLPWIHYGQEVEFTTIAYPGDAFRGRISFIAPYMDPETRTVNVRVNVDNTSRKLKPEMFVNATVSVKVDEAGRVYDPSLAGKWISPMHPEIIKDEPGTCDICGMPLVKAEELGFVQEPDDMTPPLVVPASAVLITGPRAVVYVEVPEQEKPAYEGREITLGPRLGDSYIVREGLQEGEEVVVHGSFKIDSAMAIQAKPSMMSAKDATPEEETAWDRQKMMPQEEIDFTEEAIAQLLPLYRPIWKALYSDDLPQAKTAFQTMKEKANEVGEEELSQYLAHAGHAKKLSALRILFRTLSNEMIESIDNYGPPGERLYVTFCPMAFDDEGAPWIQWENEEILNPYFGSQMLNCGWVERPLEGSEEPEAKQQ